MRRQLLTRVSLIVTALAVVAAQTASSAQSASPPAHSGEMADKDLNLHAYVELLRSDVRAGKVAIITELMAFSEAEDAAFWPIYREYELELTNINDERVSAIQEYAKSYDHMTDEIADRLATKALELESRRTAVKSKYYDRIKSKLSGKTAARFLQVENQLLMLIDLQIAASLPVVK